MTQQKKAGTNALGSEYQESIRTLYASSFDQLVGYLQARFRSCPHQAKEIAQQAFEQIVTRKGRGPIDNLKAFLWRTAHNIAVSELRSQRVADKYRTEARIMLCSSTDQAQPPEKLLEAREQLKVVREVLRGMPENRRRAFILTRIEGLSFAEAALRLGMSKPAVSKHVARAVTDLYVALHRDANNQRNDHA